MLHNYMKLHSANFLKSSIRLKSNSPMYTSFQTNTPPHLTTICCFPNIALDWILSYSQSYWWIPSYSQRDWIPSYSQSYCWIPSYSIWLNTFIQPKRLNTFIQSKLMLNTLIQHMAEYLHTAKETEYPHTVQVNAEYPHTAYGWIPSYSQRDWIPSYSQS